MRASVAKALLRRGVRFVEDEHLAERLGEQLARLGHRLADELPHHVGGGALDDFVRG